MSDHDRTLDPIAEFQHRFRMAAHDVGGLWFVLDGQFKIGKREGKADLWLLRQAMRASGCLAVVEGCDPLPMIRAGRHWSFVHPDHINRYLDALREIGEEPTVEYRDWHRRSEEVPAPVSAYADEE